MSVTQPSFKAKTIIKSSDNLLSKKEIKTLTKMGEKIGLVTDTIEFSVKKGDKNVGIAYNANFNASGNKLELRNIKEQSANSNHFEYIKERMKYFKSLYKRTGSFGA